MVMIGVRVVGHAATDIDTNFTTALVKINRTAKKDGVTARLNRAI